MTQAATLIQIDLGEPAAETRAMALLQSLADPTALAADYYRSVEGPPSIALSQTFESLAAIPQRDSSFLADRGLNFARHVTLEVADDAKTLEPAPFLMIVSFCVPDARCTEVDRWYEYEHAPLLLKAEGWLRARRCRAVASEGNARWTHIALHSLRDIETLASKERAFARSTEWRARLEQEQWFQQAGRWVYERVNPENLGAMRFKTGSLSNT